MLHKHETNIGSVDEKYDSGSWTHQGGQANSVENKQSSLRAAHTNTSKEWSKTTQQINQKNWIDQVPEDAFICTRNYRLKLHEQSKIILFLTLCKYWKLGTSYLQ